MTVSLLYLDLRVLGCQSSREKRRLMRAIMDKLRQHFNVSVAEVDRDSGPGLARLAVAALAPARREAREALGRVADAVAVHPRVELLRQEIIEV